jgi:lipopolysaccharide biosynthesis regulator YciM
VGPDQPDALGVLGWLVFQAAAPGAPPPLARGLGRVEEREAGPVEAPLWVDLAETERAEGHADAARRALKRALRRDPRCVRAWIALGELEAEAGRMRKALAAWRRVLAIDRRAGPRVYPRLAASFAAAGRPLEHEAYLRALVDAQSEDLEARLALARALEARGAVDEALAALREALERHPDAVAAHGLLGRTLLAEGRAAEAAKAHEELLDLLERSGRAEPIAQEGEAFA